MQFILLLLNISNLFLAIFCGVIVYSIIIIIIFYFIYPEFKNVILNLIKMIIFRLKQ